MRSQIHDASPSASNGTGGMNGNHNLTPFFAICNDGKATVDLPQGHGRPRLIFSLRTGEVRAAQVQSQGASPRAPREGQGSEGGPHHGTVGASARAGSASTSCQEQVLRSTPVSGLEQVARRDFIKLFHKAKHPTPQSPTGLGEPVKTHPEDTETLPLKSALSTVSFHTDTDDDYDDRGPRSHLHENIESTRNTESRRDFESNIKPKDHLAQPQHQDRTVEQQSNLETADTDGRSEGHSKVDDIDGKETFEAINNIEPDLMRDDIDSNAKIDGKENIELTLPGKETIDASNHLVQPQHQDHTVIQQSNLETADTDGRSVGHSKVDDIDFNAELTIPGKETIEAINNIEPDLMRDDIDSNAKPQICTPKKPAKPTSETLVAAAPPGTPAPDSSHNTGADDLACTVCDPGTAKDMCGTCAEQIKDYPVVLQNGTETPMLEEETGKLYNKKYSVSFKSLSQYARVTLKQEVIQDERCGTCTNILPKDMHEPLGLFADADDGTLGVIVCRCSITKMSPGFTWGKGDGNDLPKGAKWRKGPLRPRKGKKR